MPIDWSESGIGLIGMSGESSLVVIVIANRRY